MATKLEGGGGKALKKTGFFAASLRETEKNENHGPLTPMLLVGADHTMALQKIINSKRAARCYPYIPF